MNYTEQYWLRADRSYEIIHACGGCGRKQSFVNTGCFRVNANGNKLDIWLIYQCGKCRHTLNVPIFERVNSTKIDRDLYERMISNDTALAEKYGKDSGFLKSKRLEPDSVTVGLRLYDRNDEIAVLDIGSPRRIAVYNESGTKLRVEKVVSLAFDISRSMAKKLIESGKVLIEQNQNALIIEVL